MLQSSCNRFKILRASLTNESCPSLCNLTELFNSKRISELTKHCEQCVEQGTKVLHTLWTGYKLVEPKVNATRSAGVQRLLPPAKQIGNLGWDRRVRLRGSYEQSGDNDKVAVIQVKTFPAKFNIRVRHDNPMYARVRSSE